MSDKNKEFLFSGKSSFLDSYWSGQFFRIQILVKLGTFRVHIASFDEISNDRMNSAAFDMDIVQKCIMELLTHYFV